MAYIFIRDKGQIRWHSDIQVTCTFEVYCHAISWSETEEVHCGENAVMHEYLTTNEKYAMWKNLNNPKILKRSNVNLPERVELTVMSSMSFLSLAQNRLHRSRFDHMHEVTYCTCMTLRRHTHSMPNISTCSLFNLTFLIHPKQVRKKLWCQVSSTTLLKISISSKPNILNLVITLFGSINSSTALLFSFFALLNFSRWLSCALLLQPHYE